MRSLAASACRLLMAPRQAARSRMTSAIGYRSARAPPAGVRARLAHNHGSLRKCRQRFRQADEKAAPRAVLRRADADAGAVADLILLVEEVDHIKARSERAGTRDRKNVRHTGVDLGVIRQTGAIRNAGTAVRRGFSGRQRQTRTQTRTNQEIRTEARVPPQVRNAAGSRLLLLMIEMNVIVRDVAKILRRKVELRRFDVFALGTLGSEVQISREFFHRVIGGEFRTVLLAVAGVKRR